VASTTAVKSVERRSIARPLVSSVVGCPTASLVAPSLLSLWRFLRCPVANPRFTAVGCPDCLCRRAALLHLCTTAQSHQHTSNPPSQQAQDAQHSCTPQLMAMRMPLHTAVVTDICRQGGLENLQHFVGSTLICFIGVVLLVGFVHA
jgi:hypothetical protein